MAVRKEALALAFSLVRTLTQLHGGSVRRIESSSGRRKCFYELSGLLGLDAYIISPRYVRQRPDDRRRSDVQCSVIVNGESHVHPWRHSWNHSAPSSHCLLCAQGMSHQARTTTPCLTVSCTGAMGRTGIDAKDLASTRAGSIERPVPVIG